MLLGMPVIWARHPADKFRTSLDDLIAQSLLEYLSKSAMADVLQERSDALRRQEAVSFAPAKMHSGNVQ